MVNKNILENKVNEHIEASYSKNTLFIYELMQYAEKRNLEPLSEYTIYLISRNIDKININKSDIITSLWNDVENTIKRLSKTTGLTEQIIYNDFCNTYEIYNKKTEDLEHQEKTFLTWTNIESTCALCIEKQDKRNLLINLYKSVTPCEKS